MKPNDIGAMVTSGDTPTWLDLYDYRERVARMYRERDAALRAGEVPADVWRGFRAAKDALFREHPQSALPPGERTHFAGLRYFPYAPELCLEAELAPLTPDEGEAEVQAPTSGPHAMPLRAAARLSFTLAGAPRSLTVFWIDVYGGGLFLPFRDATSAHETYGAGRYLFDTVKGSTFLRLDGTSDGDGAPEGYRGGRVLLDFNYAYSPSCAYDPRWLCPLAPRENWLDVPLRAGELAYEATDHARG